MEGQSYLATQQGICCLECTTTQHELNDNGSEATSNCSTRRRLEFCLVSGGMRETLLMVLHAVRRCPSRVDNASCNVSCMRSRKISSDSKPKEEASRGCGMYLYTMRNTVKIQTLIQKLHFIADNSIYRNNSQPCGPNFSQETRCQKIFPMTNHHRHFSHNAFSIPSSHTPCLFDDYIYGNHG